MKHLPFKLQPLPQRCILTLIDHFLGRLDRNPRQARNLPRRINGPVHTLLRRVKHSSRKPPLARLCPRKIPPRQYQLHSLTLPHRPRQPLTPAGPRNDTEFDLRLAEGRVGRTVDDIRHQRELTSTPQGHPVHGGDDGFADVWDGRGPGGDEVGVVGLAEGEVFHLLDVSAGGEGLFAAGEDNGPDGGVGVIIL